MVREQIREGVERRDEGINKRREGVKEGKKERKEEEGGGRKLWQYFN